jgi:hypothetical protein
MTGRMLAVRTWLGQVFDGGESASGSLAYRNNREAIWRGDIPEKYTRLEQVARAGRGGGRAVAAARAEEAEGVRPLDEA